jgi:hypothetical protein
MGLGVAGEEILGVIVPAFAVAVDPFAFPPSVAVVAPVSVVVELAGTAPVETVAVGWLEGCFSPHAAVIELSTAAARSE